MGSSAEMDQVRALVKRSLAVNAEDSELPDVYFRFDVGPSTKRAKQGAANVDTRVVADPDKVLAEIEQRVRFLRAEGVAPKIYVRAIHHRDSHPFDSVTVEGAVDDGTDDTEPSKGVHAPAEALAMVALRLASQTERLIDRNADLAQELREQSVQGALFALAAQSAQDSSAGERMQAALQALAPTLQSSLPLLIDRLFPRDGAPAGGPTLDPGAPPDVQLDGLIDQWEASMLSMWTVAQANPGIVTPERQDRIMAALARYGMSGAPPASESSDIDG